MKKFKVDEATIKDLIKRLEKLEERGQTVIYVPVREYHPVPTSPIYPYLYYTNGTTTTFTV